MGEELRRIRSTSSSHNQKDIPQQNNRPIILNPRETFRSVSSTSNERSDDQQWQSFRQTSDTEERQQSEDTRISKDFAKQLCEAFKVKNLNQLQRLLLYQPIAPEPVPPQAKQSAYYENELIYDAAPSEGSASDITDDEELKAKQPVVRFRKSHDPSKVRRDARAFMAYQEKPPGRKWTPPSHIPQLDESIEDYDLWFYQMHQYLL